MQQEGHKFIQKLNNPETADILLKDFYAKFKIANRARDRRDMSRFKNYLTKMDLNNPVEEDITGTQTDNTKLEALSTPGVFMFKNMDKKATHYKALLKANPEVVFFTNEVLAKLADESKTFGGESLLASMSDGMAIRIPTSYRTLGDNLSTMDPQEYERAIERFEKRIQIAKEILFTPEGEPTGAQVAFSDTGYGDSTKMPEKLFVYLSRRLYEEFGYVNPGSELYKEIEEIVIRRQGISDQEIIEKFDQETSDPFKCD